MAGHPGNRGRCEQRRFLCARSGGSRDRRLDGHRPARDRGGGMACGRDRRRVRPRIGGGPTRGPTGPGAPTARPGVRAPRKSRDPPAPPPRHAPPPSGTPPPLAETPAPRDVLVDAANPRNLSSDEKPDPADPQQRVAFGTSGHRGSSLKRAFNEAHILAVTQAVCEYRKAQGTSGPLYLGKDTHALSDPAQETALEVLAANDLHVLWSRRATPTPVISHAILTYNRGLSRGFADGIVITPSHNPPEDGGIKYNPPNGGPAA